MNILGTALTLGGIGQTMDFGFDLLGGYLGSMIGASTSKDLMKKQYKYQAALMERQNRYNVYNYQHQHQWRVADLRAAGLNPILSASGGSAVAPVSNPGVSSGSGSNPMGNSARFSGILRDVLNLQSEKVKSEIEANKATAALSQASAVDRLSSAKLNSARAGYEEVKAKTAQDYRSFYDTLKAKASEYGKSFADWYLNSSWGFNREVQAVEKHLRDYRRDQERKKRGSFYDPERKIFIINSK